MAADWTPLAKQPRTWTSIAKQPGSWSAIDRLQGQPSDFYNSDVQYNLAGMQYNGKQSAFASALPKS